MAHMLEAQGQALRTGVTGEWNKFQIKARKTQIDGVTQAVLVAFDGPSKPIIKFQYKPDQVTVLYKPLVSGDYKLEISKDGEPINGSPFRCKIKGTTEVRPERIKFEGDGLTKGKVLLLNEVTIDYTEANISGKLKVSMEGPTFPMLKYGKPDLRVIEVSDAVKRIQYTPKFAGKYKLHLGFDDAKVPGSPFPVLVE